MDDDRRPLSEPLDEELNGPDAAGHTTAKTGASGESSRDDAPELSWSEDASERTEADATVVGPASSGGSGPGFVAPPPGTAWPDPLGGDDEDREVERRTR